MVPPSHACYLSYIPNLEDMISRSGILNSNDDKQTLNKRLQNYVNTTIHGWYFIPTYQGMSDNVRNAELIVSTCGHPEEDNYFPVQIFLSNVLIPITGTIGIVGNSICIWTLLDRYVIKI